MKLVADDTVRFYFIGIGGGIGLVPSRRIGIGGGIGLVPSSHGIGSGVGLVPSKRMGVGAGVGCVHTSRVWLGVRLWKLAALHTGATAMTKATTANANAILLDFMEFLPQI